MKLLAEYKKQIAMLIQGAELRRAWFTSFNCAIEFFETFILPATLSMDVPKTRLDYEALQKELTERKIDLRIFCDRRMLRGLDNKRTAIDVHALTPATFEGFSQDSLFHPKVIYLEDTSGRAILGSGSANLTASGWSKNQEVFAFHSVASVEQSRQIHEFFRPLIDDKKLILGKNFCGKDDSWRFVHSFQEQIFLLSMLNEDDEYLAVWSPYFPANDLAGWIDQLKDYVDLPDLKLLITPDRVYGKYIRTQWNEALQAKIDDGEVIFYASALEPQEQSELCHAKIWKTAGNLAIGSWNFTAQGANGQLDEDYRWLEFNNVEAGFIYKNDNEIDDALGKLLDLQPDDFASEELMDHEALSFEVDENLPFTLAVKFDWKEQQYTIVGEWLNNGKDSDYHLKLPDVDNLLPITGRRSGAQLGLEPIMLDCAVELLNQHNYIVYHGGNEVARGFILEQEVDYRRVQTYESLSELFDALAMQVSPDNTDGTVVRSEINRDQELFDEDYSPVAGETQSAGTSYFRLFQAMEVYKERLNAIKKYEQLEKVVFVYPGCLSEIQDKIIAKLNDGQDIFNWFLVQEFNQLVSLAERRYVQVRPKGKGIPTKPPAHKWGRLAITEPKIPKLKKQPKAYLKLVKAECGYD